MKITIIGRGNAGCISAMHLAYFRQFVNTTVEIELLYDSNIPPVPTGQGTGLDFPPKLFENFGSNVLETFPHTVKTGIMYENWSKKNKKFFHPYPVGNYSLHFQPKSFQDYVCNNLKINFKEKDENIKDYNEVDSDYIIDCRGKPETLNSYYQLINPLNCALLSELPFKKNDVKWTRAIAHKNGWCFYIPLPETTSVGYLFNNTITSVEEAKKDFKKTFKVKKIKQVFPFNQYVAKKPIIDKRILLNGNKLFFLEPLEATAMTSYNHFIKIYFDYMFNGYNEITTKVKIYDFLTKIQNFILWQYSKNTFYNTKFWKYSKTLYKKHDTSDIEKYMDSVKHMSKQDTRKNLYDANDCFAQWQKWNMRIFYENKI
tara:strand:+ start:115 stop:1230 length:1116 start_codon:yes stop_codon:yes gene_type:complete